MSNWQVVFMVVWTILLVGSVGAFFYNWWKLLKLIFDKDVE